MVLHLTWEQKNKIVQHLLTESVNGVPIHGKFREAGLLFGVCDRTVRNIWKVAKKQRIEGKSGNLVSSRKGKHISKQVTLDEEKILSIHWIDRSTIRDLAEGLKVSKSTVGRWIKEGLVKAHTNAIKPLLTDINKLARVLFSLSHLYVDKEDNIIKFNSMHNVIHIDEKWFYITKTSHRFYKLSAEEHAHRVCKSKRFITKVMFICVVGRPLYSSDGTLIFDGKIGMFPFNEEVEAVGNSKNRLKGTMEIKNIESITKEIMKDCLINRFFVFT